MRTFSAGSRRLGLDQVWHRQQRHRDRFLPQPEHVRHFPASRNRPRKRVQVGALLENPRGPFRFPS